MEEHMIDHDLFWIGVGLILLTLALTICVFRNRWFDRGYQKGEAANRDEVRRQNPPDRSHRRA
jgi:hypothetical protein